MTDRSESSVQLMALIAKQFPSRIAVATTKEGSRKIAEVKFDPLDPAIDHILKDGIIFENDAETLCGRFGKCFEEGLAMSGKLEKKISKIEKSARQELQKGRFYSYSCETKSRSQVESDVFSVYAQYLELMGFHNYVFHKDVAITENDVVKIWAPILERLFRRTDLRTKWGEIVGDSVNITDSAGFKVDLRALKDYLLRIKKEADKANCEVAKFDPSLIKITSDRTKLLIESKAVLDKLVGENPEKANDITIPGLQIIGNKAILYSLRLAANGLYVDIKEGTAVIPNHVSHIKDFRETVLLLYKFKNATIKVETFGLIGGNDSSSKPASWVQGT
ncbi:hypothetical protein G6F55_000946 [Rhizopus delemar]|uniref:Uncharacterized protein n=2 Tax=Rhizopus TaxID=4842 RepID=A0A9P6Z592_9FUNG|nr:hypothetical protein G6F55_000946 [Rhizopus delemar]KAG1527581.1 hypothetical protein G6F52_001405 [Rhizopus delemar]KAG1545022.1 hypothetical protein G6F51_005706 [Rhizopus arrhizus]KAG1570616.1 hypothetical protein G6F50_005335 [Rhizopus delemar]KAG1630333.1 hypothetical protein G6F45_005576 [Rhizopus arrhizus]